MVERSGFGFFVFIMFGVRGLGRLVFGEILVIGDVSYFRDFFVGGEVVGRIGWEAFRGVGSFVLRL